MEEHDPYVDISEGFAQWLVVLCVWDEDIGMYNIWQSYPGYYGTPQEAAGAALDWAQTDDLRCAFYGPVQEIQEENFL